MNPIRRAGVLRFIHWLSRAHPEVKRLSDLNEPEFLALAVEYEGSNGLQLTKDHQVYMKWSSTHWVFKDSDSDEDALQRLV